MQLEALKTELQFKGEPGLVLQDRDLEILRCCYEQQFLVHEQIERFYFSSSHTQNARSRISKLKRAGLLRTEVAAGLSRVHLLRVSDTGRRLARSLSPFDVPQSKKVDLATLTHDRIVTDVRLRLRQLWNATWVPEKALKDRYKQIPDGLVQFEETHTAVAVEVENSLKRRARFLTILNEWSHTEGVRIVFYVATSRKLYEAIETHFKSAPSKPVFALVELNALMTGIPQALSPRGLLDLFNRRSL